MSIYTGYCTSLSGGHCFTRDRENTPPTPPQPPLCCTEVVVIPKLSITSAVHCRRVRLHCLHVHVDKTVPPPQRLTPFPTTPTKWLHVPASLQRDVPSPVFRRRVGKDASFPTHKSFGHSAALFSSVKLTMFSGHVIRSPSERRKRAA